MKLISKKKIVDQISQLLLKKKNRILEVIQTFVDEDYDSYKEQVSVLCSDGSSIIKPPLCRKNSYLY